MDSVRAFVVVCLLVCLGGASAFGQEDGFTPLFNGVDFTGWEGNFHIFRIEDEAIVAGFLDSRRSPVSWICSPLVGCLSDRSI